MTEKLGMICYAAEAKIAKNYECLMIQELGTILHANGYECCKCAQNQFCVTRAARSI
jgi:hypothetical protein